MLQLFSKASQPQIRLIDFTRVAAGENRHREGLAGQRIGFLSRYESDPRRLWDAGVAAIEDYDAHLRGVHDRFLDEATIENLADLETTSPRLVGSDEIFLRGVFAAINNYRRTSSPTHRTGHVDMPEIRIHWGILKSGSPKAMWRLWRGGHSFQVGLWHKKDAFQPAGAR